MVHAISSEFTLNLITLTLIRLVDYRNEQLRKVCVNSPRLFSRRVVSLKAYRSEKSGKYKNCSRWLIDLKLKLILVPNVCAIWLYHYPWCKNFTFRPQRVCPKHSWTENFFLLFLHVFSFTCPAQFLACPIIFGINSVRNGNSLVLISTL